MKMRVSISVGVLLIFAAGLAVAEEVKVSGAHNCCGMCAKLMQETLGKVEGVSEVTAKPKASEFTFQATDQRTARRAIAALARVGFHGKAESSFNASFRDNSGVKPGKVSELTLAGIHNCCPGCCKAAKAVVAKVEGVESDTLEPKKRQFVVKGNFDGAALVKALNDAGFHVRDPSAVAQRKKKKADN